MKRDLTTAALGGGVGGLLDAVYAIVAWGLIPGNGIPFVFQSVASALLGLNAWTGGLRTATFGFVLHLFVAFVMALVYVRASRRLRVLVARPVLMGVLYGLLLFVIMNFVVIPLTAIGYRSPSAWGFWRALLPHILILGPAIALITARRDSKPIS